MPILQIGSTKFELINMVEGLLDKAHRLLLDHTQFVDLKKWFEDQILISIMRV